MPMMNYVAMGLAVLMVALLVRRYRRDAWHRRQARSSLFTECANLLTEQRYSDDAGGLPQLHGVYAGYQVTLGMVEDTLAWRKLPPLWLLVTVHAKAPSSGTLDLIARPANNEFYSPAWQWEGNLRLPTGWPQHAILKYRRQPADLAVLNRFVPRMFDDVHMKELLLTPALLRLTYMVKQADRGEYLIMRNAVYDAVPIPHSVVQGLLQQAVTLRATLEQAAETAMPPLHMPASAVRHAGATQKGMPVDTRYA